MKKYFLLLSLLFISACSNIKDTSEPPVELKDIQPTYKITENWSVSIGEQQSKVHLDLSPLVYAGVVYVVSPDGRITAIEQETGKIIWSKETGYAASSGIASNGISLFFGTQNGELVSSSIEDGHVVWVKDLKSEIIVAPVANDDYVLAQSSDGSLHCLAVSSGNVNWSSTFAAPKLSLRGNARPFLVSGLAYVGLDNGDLVAIVLESGRKFWSSKIGLQRGKTEFDRVSDVDMIKVDLDGALFASAQNSVLALVNPSNGQVAWTAKIITSKTAQVDQKSLYVVDEVSRIWSLNKRTGEKRWYTDVLRGRKLSGIALAEQGLLLVCDFEGYVHVIDKESGEVVARAKLLDKPLSGDVFVQDGSYYLLTRDSKLISFTLSTAT